MKASLLLSFLFVAMLGPSCKKSKSGDDAGISKITTLELESSPPDYSIYGLKYTFRVRFEELGNVTEFGILYVPWIRDKTQKTPLWGDAGTLKVPFDGSPSAGAIATQVTTLRFADFNDVNYRAYAVSGNGTVVYGEVLYFVSN